MKTIIITGEKDAGKTRLIELLVEYFQVNEVSISGFYSRKIMHSDYLAGFNLIDISLGNNILLCDRIPSDDDILCGRFAFKRNSIEYGNNILQKCNSEILIIDEVGLLEIRHQGWHPGLKSAFTGQQKMNIISARHGITSDIIEIYNISNCIELKLNNEENSIDELYNKIIEIYENQ